MALCIRKHACLGTLVLILVVSAPRTVQGQSWSRIDAIGYGGTGMVLGVALVLQEDCTGKGLPCLARGILLTPVAAAAGAMVGGKAGAAIGERADRGLREGNPPSGLHLGAVAAGTILAGGTVGLSIAGILIDDAGSDTLLGSPLQTATTLVAVGGVAGAVYLWSRWNELTGVHLAIEPRYSPDSGPGLAIELRF